MAESLQAADRSKLRSEPFRERFSLGQVLGEGGFGIVRLVTDKRSGEKFAVKIIRKARGLPLHLRAPRLARPPPGGHVDHGTGRLDASAGAACVQAARGTAASRGRVRSASAPPLRRRVLLLPACRRTGWRRVTRR